MQIQGEEMQQREKVRELVQNFVLKNIYLAGYNRYAAVLLRLKNYGVRKTIDGSF